MVKEAVGEDAPWSFAQKRSNMLKFYAHQSSDAKGHPRGPPRSPAAQDVH